MLSRAGLCRAIAWTLVCLGTVVLGTPPANAANPDYDQSGWHAGSVWYEGGMRTTTVVDCQSMIIANMGTGQVAMPGTGLAVGMGSEVDLDGAHPRTGESFYVHVWGRSVGTPCGGQGFLPIFSLPAGLSLDTSKQVVCFADGKTLNDATCPQPGAAGAKFQSAQSETGNPNSYKILCGYASGCLGYTWPTVMGHSFEFGVPVKASTTFNGATISGGAWVVDPYRNGLLALSAPLNVFAATAGNGAVPGTVTPVGGGAPVPDPGTAYRVTYDPPSTVAAHAYPNRPDLGPTTHGILSTATAYTNHVPGIVVVARDSNAAQLAGLSNTLGVIDQQMDAGTVGVDHLTYAASDNVGAAYRIDYDWGNTSIGTNVWGTAPNQWVAGSTQHWKLGFAPLPNGNADIATAKITWGAPQSFVVPSTAARTCGGRPVTVNIGLGQLPTEGNDVVLGTAGNDSINGGGGDDVICGGAGNDVLTGGNGNDTLYGGAGNDVIAPGNGTDVARGEAGSNTLSYADVTTAVTLDLSRATQATGASGTDTQSGFTSLLGGSGADRLGVRNGRRDLVGCGAGSDTVTADGIDRTKDCESVARTNTKIPASWVTRWPVKRGTPRVGKTLRIQPAVLSAEARQHPVKVSYQWRVGKRVVGKRTSLRFTARQRGKVVTLTTRITGPGLVTLSRTLRFARVR